MYRIFYGNKIIFDPYGDENEIVSDASLSANLNASAYLDFKMAINHPLYTTIAEKSDIVKLLWDDNVLFEGQIESIDIDIKGTKSVSCVSALDYLNDTIVRPYSTVKGESDLTAPSSVDGYFQWLIDQHNAHVKDSNKLFYIGVNQGANLQQNNFIYRSSTNNPTTASEISSQILDSLGGYLSMRYEDGRHVLNLYSDVHSMNAQIIDFGVNLKDFSKKIDTNDQYTALIAKGGSPQFMNGGFESGDFSYWESHPDTAIVTDKAQEGSYSSYVIEGVAKYVPASFFYTKKNGRYKSTVYVKNERQSDIVVHAGYQTNVLDSWSNDSETASFTIPNDDQWHECSFEFSTSVENNTKVRPYWYSDNISNNGNRRVYFDGFAFSRLVGSNTASEDPIDLTLIPDGGTQYDSDIIKSEDVIYNPSRVSRYGYREKVFTDSTITNLDDLMKAAIRELNKLTEPTIGLDVKAIDLALYMDGYTHLNVGDAVRVRSAIHNTDEYLMVSSINLNLQDPENSEYVIGQAYDSLTGQQSGYLRSLSAGINSSLDAVASLDQTTKDQAIEIGSVTEVANKAQETATSASSKADNAQQSANTAQQSANTAQQTANANKEQINAVKDKQSKHDALIAQAKKDIAASENEISGINDRMTQMNSDIDKAQSDIDATRQEAQKNFDTANAAANAAQQRADTVAQNLEKARQEAQKNFDTANAAANAAQSKADSVGSDLASFRTETNTAVQNVRDSVSKTKTDVDAVTKRASDLSDDLDATKATVNQTVTEFGEVKTTATNAASKADQSLRVSTQASQTATSASQKATSAYEDAQTAINKSSEAVQTANNVSLSLKTNYQTKSDADAKYATQASLNATSDQIKTEVSKTYATQATVNALENIANNAVQTWMGNAVPTLSNKPASDWTTSTLKAQHSGDIYYDTDTGYSYRFGSSDGSTYSWALIKDTDISKAIADAAKAQKTADAVTSNVTELKSSIPVTYATKTELTQKADSITSRVEGIAQAGTATSTKVTQLEQNVDGFKTTVSQTYETKQDALKKQSTLNQTIDGFKTNVSQTYETKKDALSKQSTLNQTLDGFKTTVSQTYATKTSLDTTNGKVTQAQATGDRAIFAALPSMADKTRTDSWLCAIFPTGNGSVQSLPSYSLIASLAASDVEYKTDHGGVINSSGMNYHYGLIRTLVSFAANKTWTFTYSHDDGSRIYVDGVVVFESVNYTTNDPVTITFAKGNHIVDIMWSNGAGGYGVWGFSAPLSSIATTMYAPAGASALASDLANVKTTYSTKSEVTQTANSLTSKISQVATNASNANDKASSALTKYSELKQTLDGFKTTVSQTYETKKDALNKKSTLEQTIDGFKTNVAQTYETKTDALSKQSTLNQTIDGFKTNVSQTYETKKDALNKKSTLEQTIDGFKTNVSQTYATKTSLNALSNQADVTYAMSFLSGTNNYWIRLGTATISQQGRITQLTLNVSKGNNGQPYQNAKVIIQIHRGWTGGDANHQFGVSVDNANWKEIQVKAFSNATNKVTIWIYNSVTSYLKGNYTVSGWRDSWEDQGLTQTGAPTGTEQQVAMNVSLEDVNDKATSALTKSSELEQTLNGFKTTVSQTYETKQDALKKQSTLNQTIDGFKTTVSQTYETKSDALNKQSTLNQKVDSLRSEVSETYATKTQLNNASSTTNMWPNQWFDTSKPCIGRAPVGNEIEAAPVGGNIRIIDGRDHYNGSVSSPVMPGRKYKVSVDAKKISGIKSVISGGIWYTVKSSGNPYDGSGDFTKVKDYGNSWYRFERTVTVPDGKTMGAVYLLLYENWPDTNSCPSKWKISNLRFEDVTDVADIQANYSTKSYVDQTARTVSLGVVEEYKNGQHGSALATQSDISVAKDSITSTVSQTYLSKTDASSQYTTKTQMQQTSDSLTMKIGEILNNPTSDNLWPNQWFDDDKPLLGSPGTEKPPSGGKSRLLAGRDHFNPSVMAPVCPGHRYRITADAKRTAGSLALRAGIWYTKETLGTPFDSCTDSTSSSSLGNDWNRYTWEVTIPSGKQAGSLYFRLEQNDSGGSTKWLVGNAILQDITAAYEAQSIANAASSNAANAQNRVGNLETCIKMTADGVRVGKIDNGDFTGYSALVNSAGSFDIVDASGNTCSSFNQNTIKLGENNNDSIVDMGNGTVKFHSDPNSNVLNIDTRNSGPIKINGYDLGLIGRSCLLQQKTPGTIAQTGRFVNVPMKAAYINTKGQCATTVEPFTEDGDGVRVNVKGLYLISIAGIPYNVKSTDVLRLALTANDGLQYISGVWLAGGGNNMMTHTEMRILDADRTYHLQYECDQGGGSKIVGGFVTITFMGYLE